VGRAVAGALAAVAVALAGCGSGAAPAHPARGGGKNPVASVRRTPAVLWAVGDGADGGDAAKAVAARIASGRVDRLLYLGDVYGSGLLDKYGDATDYRERYAVVYGRFKAETAPTPGNHEWPQRDQGYDRYWTRGGRLPPAYFAFSAAGWRILSLNSQTPHGQGSPQLTWLRARLRGPGTCRLAYWHRPRFSSGKHGDQPDMAPIWNALRRHAALVLTGHDHDMQRFKPIDGITELVSGAGGHSLYALHSDPRRAFGNDTTFGALRIVLRPGTATLAFVAADGRVLDRHTVRCHTR
jgi:acid phosphatase type 7